MAHVAESTHWYDKQGNPRYSVPAKKGGERPTTIRDARSLGLLPSVTGIIRCAAAPGLENWKADQLMLAAVTLPRREDEPESAWLARVKKDGQAEGKSAAERGTEIHTSIERYLLGQPIDEWVPHTLGAVAEVKKLCGERQWRPEKSFAHPLGYGGKADLNSADDPWLLDFKSKEFSDASGVKLWDDHFMQLAACREGLSLPMAKCAIVFVSRTVPGLSTILVCPEDEVQRGWRMFTALLSFWQAKNGWPWSST